MHFVPPTRVLSPVSEDPTPEDLNRPKISTLWFPPPPPLPPSFAPPIIEETKKTKKSTKYSPQSVPPTRTRSNFRHGIGQSTKARRKRLQGTQLPAIKLTLQHWILLSLLLLSFIILICGFIFAGCVALPHTGHHDASTNDNNNSTDAPNADDSFPYEITVYRRQQDPPANVLYSATPQATGLPQLDDILNAGSAEEAGDALTAAEGAANTTTTTTTTTTPDSAGTVGNTTTTPATTSTSSTPQPTNSDESYASEAKRLGYESPKNLTILFLYIATLPLLTILHTTILLINLCRTRRDTSTTAASLSRSNSNSSTSSDSSDFIAKLKARAHSHAPPPKPTLLSTLTKPLTILIPLVLTLAWTVLNSIQLHCEIHPPSSPSPSSSPNNTSNNKAICPIQIQTHSMRGIHELSIARNVFGWFVIAVYTGYCVWVIRAMVVMRKEERKRRGVWEVEERREEMLRGMKKERLRDESGMGGERKSEKAMGTAVVVRFAAQRDLDIPGHGDRDGNRDEREREV